MINVKFFHSENGAPLGFSFKGHAGYAAHGSDIVCAAISSVAYMTANTIIEIMGVEADVTVKEDGEMTLKIPEESAEKTKELLLGLELHINELKKQYPKNVTITTEV